MELPLATWTPGRPRVPGHAALLQTADRPEGDGLDASHSRGYIGGPDIGRRERTHGASNEWPSGAAITAEVLPFFLVP